MAGELSKLFVTIGGDSSPLKRELKGVKGQAKGMEKSFSGLGNIIAGAFAAGSVIAFGKSVLKTITEFEQSMASLRSVTGATQADMDKFGDSALELSKKFGTSADDIVKGFQFVKSAMAELDTADVIKITEQADILAKAIGVDASEGARILTNAMNQFGASADEAANFIDILATSQQKGTALATQLGESFKNVGSTLRSANLSFETGNALLQGLAKGAITGAEAGTKLRSILTILAETGRDDLNPALVGTTAVLDTLAKEIPDLTSATALFGRENAAAALTLVDQREAVKALDGALLEHGNALSQAIINTDTLGGATDKLGSSWDALVLSIDKGDGAMSQAAKSTVNLGTAILDLASAAVSGASMMEVLGNFANDYALQTGEITKGQAKLTKSLIENRFAIELLGEKFKSGEISIDEYKDVLRRLVGVAKEVKKGLKDAGAGADELADAAAKTGLSIASIETEIGVLEAIREQAILGSEAFETATQKIKALKEQLPKTDSEIKAAAASAKKLADEIARAAKETEDNFLKALKEVEKILEGTLARPIEIDAKINFDKTGPLEPLVLEDVEIDPAAIKGMGIKFAEFAKDAEGVTAEFAEKTQEILGLINAVSDAWLTKQMANIDERFAREAAAIENGVGSEEEKTERLIELEKKATQEKAKAAKKKAKIDKAVALVSVIVDTAAGVVKVIAATPATFGLPFSAFVAASGAAQAALIASTPIPSMRVGGTIMSDGLINAHAGETIVPATANMPFTGGGALSVTIRNQELFLANNHGIRNRESFT